MISEGRSTTARSARRNCASAATRRVIPATTGKRLSRACTPCLGRAIDAQHDGPRRAAARASSACSASSRMYACSPNELVDDARDRDIELRAARPRAPRRRPVAALQTPSTLARARSGKSTPGGGSAIAAVASSIRRRSAASAGQADDRRVALAVPCREAAPAPTRIALARTSRPAGARAAGARAASSGSTNVTARSSRMRARELDVASARRTSRTRSGRPRGSRPPSRSRAPRARCAAAGARSRARPSAPPARPRGRARAARRSSARYVAAPAGRIASAGGSRTTRRTRRSAPTTAASELDARSPPRRRSARAL